MKLVLDTIAVLTVINMCSTMTAAIVRFPESAEGDDIQAARRHVMYLVHILDKLGELSNLKDIGNIPSTDGPETDYADFGLLLDSLRSSDQSMLGKYIPRNQPGRNELNSIVADTESDINPFSENSHSSERFSNIQKKDYAILPPSNEWCRMMGFRRCRRYRS